MNKYISYLEKVALNVGKARAMAKSVGLIPDHTSAWKYALRELRDGRGVPLKGKSLQDAKINLGGLKNNAFRKIQSTANAKGSAQGYEFSTKVGRDGSIPKRITFSPNKEMVDRSALKITEDNLHTHPSTNQKLYGNLVGSDTARHRNAQPSGAEDLRDYIGDSSNTHIKNRLNLLNEDIHSLHSDGRISRHGVNLSDRLAAAKRIHSSIPRVSSEMDKLTKFPKSPLQSDALLIADQAMRGNRGYAERILSPHTDTLSINKMRPQGMRTVYMDYTPKKAK